MKFEKLPATPPTAPSPHASVARWLFLRMLQSAVHRSRPSSAYPRHVSWVPLGPVLEGIVHRTTFERWELIEELACLARHCDWGVEGVRGHGAVRYRFKYFSSMAPLHDPTAGLAPTWWKPTALERRGAGMRYKAYGSLHAAADGTNGAAQDACDRQMQATHDDAWRGGG